MKFDGPVWKVLLGIATGEVQSAAIIVGRADADGEAMRRREVLAVWHNSPPCKTAAVWINDATASRERLEFVLGVNVTDKTPDGRIELVQRAVQVPRDITRQTSAKTVAALLRGVLIDHPNFCRVGVICHRTHVQTVEAIGAEFRQRIAKVSYFGSGDERASPIRRMMACSTSTPFATSSSPAWRRMGFIQSSRKHSRGIPRLP